MRIVIPITSSRGCPERIPLDIRMQGSEYEEDLAA